MKIKPAHPEVHIPAPIRSEIDAFDQDGAFAISDRPKFGRLDDRIIFLYRRFSGRKFDRSRTSWAMLQSGIKLRNDVVHPKALQSLTPETVSQSLTAILDTMDYMSQGIYQRKLPIVRRGLFTTLDL